MKMGLVGATHLNTKAEKDLDLTFKTTCGEETNLHSLR